MTNRTTKIASAIVMGAAIGSFVTGTTPLRAAEDCLSKPKGPAPAGSHWYYRVDRATKRNCWYIAAEGRPVHSAKSSAAPALRQAQTPLQPSVANARAEAAPADIAQPGADAATLAPAGPSSSNLNDNPPVAESSQGAVASRWLDQPSPDAAKTAPPPANFSADVKPPTPLATTPPAPAVPAIPLAAADARPASPSSSIPKLFFVMLGALGIAAIFGAVIFKFGTKPRNDRRTDQRERRAPWESIDVGATIDSPPLATKADTPRFAREYEKPAIPSEIVQLLSRLSKEAAA